MDIGQKNYGEINSKTIWNQHLILFDNVVEEFYGI